MQDRKVFIPLILIAFLVILLGCSSFFSFSWNTSKKIGKTREKDPKMSKTVSGFTPESREPLKPHARSFEIQITRLEGKTPAELEAFMERLKEHNIRTIFFRVFQNPGDGFFEIFPRQAREGVYFKTSYAPLVSDLLPSVCRMAHERGIAVYAWMNTFKAKFLRCDGARRLYRYDPQTDRIEETPAWNPFDPKVQTALVGLFSDLARNSIDGILVQDDMVLRYTEALGRYSRTLFAGEKGGGMFAPRDLYVFGRSESGKRYVNAYTPLFWEWCRWKSRELAKLAGRLKAAVKKVRPSAIFAVDVNYEALMTPENALAWFSWSIPTMEEVAHPDLYVVMSYQRQMAEELEKPEPVILGYIEQMVVSALRLIPDPNRWVFKVQTVDWRTRRRITFAQIRKTLETIESAAPVRV